MADSTQSRAEVGLAPRASRGQDCQRTEERSPCSNLACHASALRVARGLKHTSHLQSRRTSTAGRLFLAHALCLLQGSDNKPPHTRALHPHPFPHVGRLQRVIQLRRKHPLHHHQRLEEGHSPRPHSRPMSVAQHARSQHQTERTSQRTWHKPPAHECTGRARRACPASYHPNTLAPLGKAPDAHPLTFARAASSQCAAEHSL